MNLQQLKELAQEAVKDGIAHGYRDYQKPLRRLLTKAVCELAEAVSAYRDEKMAGKVGYLR